MAVVNFIFIYSDVFVLFSQIWKTHYSLFIKINIQWFDGIAFGTCKEDYDKCLNGFEQQKKMIPAKTFYKPKQ